MEIKIGEIIEKAQVGLLNHWNNDKDAYDQVRTLTEDTLCSLKKSMQEQSDTHIEDWEVLEAFINMAQHFHGNKSKDNVIMAIIITYGLENEAMKKDNKESYSKGLVSIICEELVDHMLELNKEKYENRN